MNLCDVRVVKEIMERYGISFRKEFGQNFLTDPFVVEDIATVCAPYDTSILEIGPGIGTLTRELCKAHKKVLALEIDRGLIPVLEETLAEFDNVTVLNQDVMKSNLKDLVNEYFPDGKFAVCANLPYYITSPILMLILESGLPFESVTVMVQKEVADRLNAKAGSGDYGAITAVVNYYGKTEKVENVPAHKFMPPPKVDSAVIKITLYKEKPYHPIDEKLFFDVIHGAFGQRRKTLLNALTSAFPNLTKDTLRGLILSMGLDENIRGERLTTEDFVALSNLIHKETNKS